MACTGEEYEEEWEAEELSIDKKNVISTIHPLESDENTLTRDAEPTTEQENVPELSEPVAPPNYQLKTSEDDFRNHESKAKVDEIAVPDVCNMSEEIPTSDDTLSSVEDEKALFQQRSASNTKASERDSTTLVKELVRIHGQRYSKLAPPPIPVSFSKSFREAKQTPKQDIGALQARVAAKRIADFRRRQALQADEVRALESAWAQKRREIRRSNDEMYKNLGVAGLSAQDHLRIAQRRQKQEARKAEMTASQERQNRWYNNIPKRSISAADHVQELNSQYSRAKREQQREMLLKQKSIRANQLELRQKAQAIITKMNGTYVRGSFLLKVTQHAMAIQKEGLAQELEAE